jgi:NAD(P)-dependent dehydrogenase (short-subunit alcohol dehydrogenase family)
MTIVLVARRADKLKGVRWIPLRRPSQYSTTHCTNQHHRLRSIAALFDTVKKRYGHADLLINHAGLFKAIASSACKSQHCYCIVLLLNKQYVRGCERNICQEHMPLISRNVNPVTPPSPMSLQGIVETNFTPSHASLKSCIKCHGSLQPIWSSR